MKLIKINYNNLAVKKPKELTPEIFMFRRVFLNDDGTCERKIFLKKFDGRFDLEPYYTNIFAEFSINDILLFYADKYLKETSLSNVLDKEPLSLKVDINGYYINEVYNFKNKFSVIKNLDITPICSNEFFCTEEDLYADTYHEGYLFENNFYYNEGHTINIEVKDQEKCYDKNSESFFIYNAKENKYIEI